MKLFTITLLISTILLQSAFASDVVGEKNRIKIEKKTVSSQEFISFSLCTQKKLIEVCTPLGEKSFYSVKALQTQQAVEVIQVVGAGAVDGAIIAGLIFAGMYGGSVLAVGGAQTYAMALSAGFTGAGIGGIAGGALGVYLSSTLRSINASTQLKDVQSLNQRILKDIDYQADDEFILDLASSLKVVLTSIK